MKKKAVNLKSKRKMTVAKSSGPKYVFGIHSQMNFDDIDE